MKTKKILIWAGMAFVILLLATVAYLYSYCETAKRNYAFLQAALEGDITEIKKALDNGIDINAKTYFGDTALNLAVDGGKVDAAKLLLKRGINSTAVAQTGNTALTYAIKRGNYEMVQLLLNSGVPATQRIAKYMSALYFAVQEGHLDIVKLLIQRGADVNRKYFKDTPLSVAATKGDVKIAKLLVEKGAKIDSRSIYFAKANKQKEILDLFYKHGIAPHEVEKMSQPPN